MFASTTSSITPFSADTASAAPEPSLPLWESITRQAIKDERDKRHACALAGYERALPIAQQLINAPPSGRAEDCLAALVVSYHNLADLRVAQGEFDTAAHLLCRAHESLVALALHAERPAALREAALRHTRESHVALIRHVARHGPHPLIADVLKAADAALHQGNATPH
jgi:hypothetical protein